MEEEKQKINWWKFGTIIGLISLGILFGIILQAKFISGAEWPLSKQATCKLDSINKTGLDCDIYWCNTIQGGNYSLQKEVCIFNTITNTTQEANNSNDLMNESRIKDLCSDIFNNKTIELKLVNQSELILVKNSILESQDNRTENIVRTFLSTQYVTPQTNNALPGYVWVAVIFALFGLVGFVIWNSTKQKAEQKVESIGVTSIKKPYKTINKSVIHQKIKPKIEEQIEKYEETDELPEEDEDSEVEEE